MTYSKRRASVFSLTVRYQEFCSTRIMEKSISLYETEEMRVYSRPRTAIELMFGEALMIKKVNPYSDEFLAAGDEMFDTCGPIGTVISVNTFEAGWDARYPAPPTLKVSS